MDSWFGEHVDLVAIYCGNDPSTWVLPTDVMIIVLGFAGLAMRSRHQTYFVLWC